MLPRFLPARSVPCRVLGVALLLLLTVAGCNSHEKETAVVRGTVTLDGKPFAGGSIIFAPAAGRGANGEIAADGSYSLTTYSLGDGAIVGLHKVAIFPPGSGLMAPEKPVANPVSLPERYQNTASSGLEFKVESGKENIFDIKMTSAPQ